MAGRLGHRADRGGGAGGGAAFPAFTQPSAGGFPVSLPALLALVLAGAAAASGIVAGIHGVGASGQALVGAFLVYTLFIGGFAVLSGRAAQGRLSVAEERLRFARDLHDVLGRNLSLIAVTGELAAQLARLATELAGAQAVLRSAGVSCRVIGDAAGLAPDAQAALCTIELHVTDSPGTVPTVTLRMDNDRVRAVGAAPGGTGLLGLGERRAGLDGTITTQCSRGGRFRLEATLPATAAAAKPRDLGQRGTGVIADRPAP